MTATSTASVQVVPYAAVAADPAASAAIDDIFFTSSITQSFADAEARAVFRERWLGRFLQHVPESCFVAIADGGPPVGYICGSLLDPARDPRFSDQPHFAAFAAVTPAYPAQLHINVTAKARSTGVGRRLLDAYVAHARANAVPGVHAISARGARNLAFYAANGFPQVAAASINGRELVFLGRKLD
jgi:GNAT superfamily N-acetyltransferase